MSLLATLARRALPGLRPPGPPRPVLRSPIVRHAVVEQAGGAVLRGWVEVAPGAPAPRVTVLRGGTEVASAVVAQPAARAAAGEVRAFSVDVAGVQAGRGRRSRVQVRVDGVVVPVAGHGLWLRSGSVGGRP